MLSITYNNLGCYFKKLGNLETALQYFYNAIQKEASGFEIELNTAGIYLNIWAILSKLKRHDLALQNA